VRWILEHERDHEIQFAPLQGTTAAELRAKHPEIPELVDTVVLVEDDRPRLRSKAFVYVARHLRGPWRWMYSLRWLPAFLVDLGYRFIAAIRYRIWGRAELCDLPSPEHRERFLP
jgi:predicted DCC family thiol-disulfide oxidoreductase YuxK